MKPNSSLQHSITPPLRACLLVALLLLSFILHPSSFAAESPLYIPFQGQVTNQAGVLSADGQYSVIFNLYDQAVGGQPVWSERHVKIGVTRGMINVFLGSISPLSSVDFSQTKFLGITVDTDNLATTADPEMVPRSLIMPAFHAKNSDKLAGHNWSAFMTSNNPSTAFIQSTRIAVNTIDSSQITDNAVTTSKIADSAITGDKLADGLISTAKLADSSITNEKLVAAVAQALVPPGTILPYGGSVAPAGYVLCDGKAYPRAGAYANLFATVGASFGASDGSNFNVPDLRGQFLRGVMPNLQATFTGSPSSSNITVPAHPFNRTGMTVRVTSPLSGLTAGTDYFVIVVSSNEIAFATTKTNALAETKISLSGTATGMVVTQAEDPDVISRLAMAKGATGIGALLGSVQADDLKNHSHLYNRPNVSGPPAVYGGGDGPAVSPSQQATNSTGGSETRPKNAYVNYIIKY